MIREAPEERRSILLVTGSRSLAPNDDAVRWGHRAVSQAIRMLGAKLVVCGDADGPDEWATEEASDFNLHTSQWYVRGYVAGSHYDSWTTHHTRWATLDELRATPRLPLLRNERMVAWVADQAKRRGCAATCLALIDPESRTHGTEHTATLAERAGLRVERREWRP